MFRFRNHDHIDDPAADDANNQDLVALMNEARDPREIARLTKMARQRERARRREGGLGRPHRFMGGL